MANDKIVICQECGMPCGVTEFHPMAACLMFKGCHDSDKVRANLAALASHTGEAEPFSKAAIDYNTLTLEFAGKWRGGEKVEAGEVLDWLMTLPRVAAATPAAPGGMTDAQVRASAYKHCFKASEMAPQGEQLYLFDLARIKRLCAALSHPAPVAAPAIPEGFALVPVEPTPKMIGAAQCYGRDDYGNIDPAFAYHHMLAALKGEQPAQRKEGA